MSGWESFLKIQKQKRAVRRAKADAHYADVHCRADVFQRLRDCDNSTESKPPTQTSIDQWPPAGFNHASVPPRIASPPAVEFSVKKCPDMITTCWADFVKSAFSPLSEPFTDEEKDLFLGLEFTRQSSVCGRADWHCETMRGPRVDDAIYRNIFSVLIDPLMPVPIELEITPERYGHYGRLDSRCDYSVLASGPAGQYACLLRFLYMEDLDVCQEIQDIAAGGVNVPVLEGVSTWPKMQIATPQRRKAQDVIQWIMHAARQTYSIDQGRCNRIKLSDGWNNIWFRIDNGTLRVSPTMTPTRYDDAVTSAPMGLVHSFVSSAHLACMEIGDYIDDWYKLVYTEEIRTDVKAEEASASTSNPRPIVARPKRSQRPAKAAPTTPPDHTVLPGSLRDSGSRETRAGRLFNGANAGTDNVIRNSPRIRTPTNRYTNEIPDTPARKTVAKAKRVPLATCNSSPEKTQAVNKRKRMV